METIKKIRKYFNILSREQKKIVEKQYHELFLRAIKLQTKHQEQSDLWTKNLNYTCKKCNSKDIVDRILNNEYHEKISHCNSCNNEHKQIEAPYSSFNDMMCYKVLYLFECYMNKTGHLKYDKIRKVFFEKNKHLYAESIFYAAEQSYVRPEYIINSLSLKNLRKLFKSVHDEK